MTAKQAVDILRRGSTFAYDETEAGEFCQAYDMAVEALEKQIPKKPNMPSDAYWVCPVCGKKVGIHLSIARDAGQAIDWEGA